MKSTLVQHISDIPFEKVYQTIKERITDNGFLLLHEINTQQIVAKHGVIINPLRQLLFFEPKYIAQIMEGDYLAINDIPLKIVLHDLDAKGTSISFQNPVGNLKDYTLKEGMKEELLQRVQRILDF